MLIATLICWAATMPGFAQNGMVDSVQRQLTTHTENDTVKVNLLNELSYLYQWSDFKKSSTYADQALLLAEKLTFPRGIALANYRKAHWYWLTGNGELSIEKTLLSAKVAEQNGFVDIQGECARLLAINYRDQQEIDKAEIFAKQAEQLSVQSKNWDLLSRIYNTAGVIEASKEFYDTAVALALYRKSIKIADEHSTSRYHVCQALSNMAAVYFATDPDKSIEYLGKALALAKKTGNTTAEIGITSDLGRAYTLKGKYDEAEQFLQTALEKSRAFDLKRVTGYIYYALSDLKARAGKSREALVFMHHYYELRDSLLKTRQIVELETRYQAEQKEQAIKLLQQEKKIETLWKNVLIIGSAFLSFAAVAIFRLQQLRSKKAKQLLETQKELNAKLKETDQLKSRFFANLSHEFRTPLSLIQTPIDIRLMSATLSPHDIRDFRSIKRNVSRLAELVSQLLDLSTLEAGKMALHLTDGNLKNFIQILSASFDSLAESKRIRFVKKIALPPSTFKFDGDKLEKIIINLLFNAFKFTGSEGTVTLSVYTTNSHRLRIIISDTGQGIPKEDQPHVFSPFYQSKHNDHSDHVGSGLGLALVSELVKLWEGNIRLESEVNAGTTIEILLPLYKGEDVYFETNRATENIRPMLQVLDAGAPMNVDTIPAAAGEEIILVIEDNPELRYFIASNFAKQYTVETAKDGEEGLAKAIQLVPDLIIADVMMPKMEGTALTHLIRQDERISHVPVVLLTAKADLASKIQGLKTGADDYIIKPFSAEELQVRVYNLIEQRRQLAARYKKALTQLPNEPRVPSLEDKFIMKAQKVIENYLSDPSFSVKMLADEMCMSRAQLFRKFKAVLDTSPSEFMNDLRLQRASELIASKADTLAQISYSVGFNEQSYFAKRFRKKFGVSPSEYAKENSNVI